MIDLRLLPLILLMKKKLYLTQLIQNGYHHSNQYIRMMVAIFNIIH